MNVKKIIKRGCLFIIGILVLVIAFFILLINLPSEALPQPPIQEDLIIKNVSIVDVNNEIIRENENVLIRDGKIARVTKDQQDIIHDSMNSIDASGKYLIPGLINMHVHTTKFSSRLHFPLMIANGVTGYREMGFVSNDSSATFFTHMSDKQEWNNAILSGKMTGPLMLSVASHVIESKADMEYSVTNYDSLVSDSLLVKSFINKSVEEGADFIKIQLEDSDKNTFDLLHELSQLHEIGLSGHAPKGIDLMYSVKRLESLEHAKDILNYSVLKPTTRSKDESVGLFLGRVSDSLNQQKLMNVLDTMSYYNTAYVPTHLTRKWEAFLDDESFLSDKRLNYVPFIQKILWKIDQTMMMDLDSSKEGRAGFIKFYEKGLEVTKSAYDAGVLVMTGTDALDSYIFYGFSVHDELGEMVKAGLSPYEALKMATLNPAKFLKQENSIGSVFEAGVADLIILNSNPIEDINNTKSIYGVIHQGRYYNSGMIEQLKDFSETEASGIALNAKMIWYLIKDLLFD